MSDFLLVMVMRFFENCVVPENIHTLPTAGIGISSGVGGQRPRKILRGKGVVSIYIILSRPVPLFLYVIFFCLHFAYRSADTNTDLVNCTKVIFSRWLGSISGAARDRSFHQTAAD